LKAGIDCWMKSNQSHRLSIVCHSSFNYLNVSLDLHSREIEINENDLNDLNELKDTNLNTNDKPITKKSLLDLFANKKTILFLLMF